jgi:ribosomal protein L44E
MGEEAESILDSTNISVEERAVYDSVLRKLDDFFKVRKNVIYERARFNRRCQQDGETAEQFIRELHQLAEDCDYGDRTKEMIRDRLVVGIKDSRLSERLQLDPDLTLDKAEKIIRQSEAVHEQQVELTAGGKLVEPVVTGKGQHTVKTKRGAAKNAAATSLHLKCTRCGKERHPVDKCPARGVTCHKCHKRGHYERQCRSKSISEITNDDIAYLNVLEEDQETSWKAPVKLGETEMYFKIDTGAEVTAISEQTYRKLQNSPPLKKPDKRLLGPSRNPLKVIGQIETELNYKNKTIKHHVYIVRGLNTNLLGLPAIKALDREMSLLQ